MLTRQGSVVRFAPQEDGDDDQYGANADDEDKKPPKVVPEGGGGRSIRSNGTAQEKHPDEKPDDENDEFHDHRPPRDEPDDDASSSVSSKRSWGKLRSALTTVPHLTSQFARETYADMTRSMEREAIRTERLGAFNTVRRRGPAVSNIGDENGAAEEAAAAAARPSLAPRRGLVRATSRRRNLLSPSSRKLRILALHGAKSNDGVTSLQLANLCVISGQEAAAAAGERYQHHHRHLGGGDAEVDVVHLHGPIAVDEGDADLASMGVHGPFFSWFSEKDGELGESLIESVRFVLKAVDEKGPFDGIFGFSEGAVVAALAMNVLSDPSLRAAVSKRDEESRMGRASRGGEGLFRDSMRSLGSTPPLPTITRGSVRNLASNVKSRRNLMRQPSTRGVLAGNGAPVAPTTRRNRRGLLGGLENELLGSPDDGEYDDNNDEEAQRERGNVVPFQFAILACAAAPKSMMDLRRSAGLMSRMPPCAIPTFHLIGTHDDLHRTRSEEMAALFGPETREVWYMPGGHGIGREQRSDVELLGALRRFLRRRGERSTVEYAVHVGSTEFKPVSTVSSIAPLPGKQVVLVDVVLNGRRDAVERPRTGMSNLQLHGQTIVKMLKRQPQDAPFLRVARSDNPDAVTTYGAVLDFIQREGNLTALGVQNGDVVAYVVPDGSGAGATAALAFLSIAAQTAAAPLAPSTSGQEAVQALEQLGAKHLVLFKNPNGTPAYAADLVDAVKAYGAIGKVHLHSARVAGDEFPGIFRYQDMFRPDSPSASDETGDGLHFAQTQACRRGAQCNMLTNTYNGVSLLLRTSGTTSKPKVVPLKQGQLVANGEIIAAAMGLGKDDVCYSIMPLFHIGGISASVLCSLATGSAICCDAEPYDPERMVDALALSRPQPTWYSSVPTIHNSTVAFLCSDFADTEKGKRYGVGPNGIWKEGHSLRMIRSGAAALLGPDGEALAAAYGGVPVYPTYSMSEQMPIAQPPESMCHMLQNKPGSVGVPIAASLAIVNSSTLRPKPPGVEGEIAISGSTVMAHYQNDPDANRKSFFFLNLPGGVLAENKYFLTGDVGTVGKGGFLYLKGRSKELIKRGGEQISPFEVEEILQDHEWVQVAVCFSVPSRLYGEEVGCAIVLSSSAPEKNIEVRDVIMELRPLLRERQLAPVKYPTKWKLVQDNDLPKTKTKKYIRVGLSSVLGLDPADDKLDNAKAKVTAKAKMDWKVLNGLRFFLACYVMFMHIGSNESWGRVNNLRGFPWHVHLFFTLGGYTMAAPMAPSISKKFSFFKARIRSMLPMYYVSLILCFINLLVACRPATFDAHFHWDAQPDDRTRSLFCEGTPVFQSSYWASLLSTFTVYLLGLQITPVWPLMWWMGYYLWFSAVYYQCLAFFPMLYNALMKLRLRATRLLMITGLLFLLNVNIIVAIWFTLKDMKGYNHFNTDGGQKNDPDQYSDGSAGNIAALSFYLFAPFWAIYFAIGMSTAFLYDHYRPAERHKKRIWGHIADLITMLMIGISAALIAEGNFSEGDPLNENQWRPEQANAQADVAQANRLWDALWARMFAPITTLWVFALSTGQGYTAKFFRLHFLVDILSPTSYHCFLFHQIIGQWYFAATRQGTWWYWWGYRKTFYWFSPQPCPVEWYEYPYLVILTVCWSKLMVIVEKLFDRALGNIIERLIGKKEDDSEATTEILCRAVEDITGIEPQLHWTLEECGLGSIGLPVLVQTLNKAFAKKKGTRRLEITPSKLITAKTITDMVDIVDEAKAELESSDGLGMAIL